MIKALEICQVRLTSLWAPLVVYHLGVWVISRLHDSLDLDAEAKTG